MKNIFILILFLSVISNIPIFSQIDTTSYNKNKWMTDEISKCFSAYSEYNKNFPVNIEYPYPIEKKKDYLLYKYYRIRAFLISGSSIFSNDFYSDFKIKLPKGLKYQEVLSSGNLLRFIYKNNQAIFIKNQKVIQKYGDIDSLNNKFRYDTIYLETLKDTIFILTEDEMKKDEIRRMVVRIIGNLDYEDCKNIHCKKFAEMIFNDLVLEEDYSKSKGRKDIMIYKNGVKILLFNVKEKNIKKWTKLVQEIEVIPFDFEKYLYIFQK